MKSYNVKFLLAVLLASAGSGESQTLSKGHQILLQRGVQSMGLVTKLNPFSLSTMTGANFTGPVFEWGAYDPILMGTPPGVPWNRWVNDPNRDGMGDMADMPPVASPNETPYMPNLVMLQLGDEHDLNNATIRQNTANWFAAARATGRYNYTILYCNNWGHQLTDSAMEQYIQTSNPDMMSMDTYPWTTAPWPGNIPRDLYRPMRQLRAYSLAYNLPYNLWTQTYEGSGDVPPRVDPSDSQLRLNYFAGVAFGFTSFMCFTYNHGSTSLFNGPGDQNPTPLYTSVMSVNAKLKKLSPLLTRLKPRAKFVSGYDVSMAYYPGQHMESGIPVNNTLSDNDFRVYPGDYGLFLAQNNQDYVSSSNTGVWKGLTVTNLGIKNDSLRGDVWVMWFKVLDESFDGAAHTDEIYYVVLNGLSDPNGTGIDCRQRVTFNFVANSQTAQVLVFNQSTGQVDTVAAPLLSSRRQPSFDIDGGEVAIFKLDTGAPFVGIASASAKNWALYD